MDALKTTRAACHVVLLGLLCVAATACADPVNWPFATMDDYGNQVFFQTGYYDPTRLVIRSEPEWLGVWTKLYEGSSPIPPTPTIDFTREMIVLVAMGEQPHGGNRTLVTAAVVNGDTLEVAVDEILSNRCLTIATYTQPVAVIRGPLLAGKVTFTTNRYERTCN